MIIKGAKVFTSDRDRPYACALVVRDGKFCYVGDEAGLSEFEGEVTDLAGKFVMPAIIDSHVHVTTGVGFDYARPADRIELDGKQAILGFMADYVRDNPARTTIGSCWRRST
jgi:predicted amidohydrolase YtcJ